MGVILACFYLPCIIDSLRDPLLKIDNKHGQADNLFLEITLQESLVVPIFSELLRTIDFCYDSVYDATIGIVTT
jgi:hypothetical protein